MDIDIDFSNRSIALECIPHVIASRATDTGLVSHNTGIYLQNIPCFPDSNLSTIEYKEAERRGYFKIDFLNVSLYDGVKNIDHLKKLIDTEPLWDLLEQDDFTNLLFHVNGHGTILRKMKPRSVEQLAAVLAIIRPAKRHLIGQDWMTVMNEVWTKPTTNEFYFKKAHAIAYAHAIVVQMNLICEQLSYEYS